MKLSLPVQVFTLLRSLTLRSFDFNRQRVGSVSGVAQGGERREPTGFRFQQEDGLKELNVCVGAKWFSRWRHIQGFVMTGIVLFPPHFELPLHNFIFYVQRSNNNNKKGSHLMRTRENILVAIKE